MEFNDINFIILYALHLTELKDENVTSFDVITQKSPLATISRLHPNLAFRTFVVHQTVRRVDLH
jgi:hypothetical protein